MPKPVRIESVTAARFRGASRSTTLTFDPSKAFVLLFGENGTGKSTMVDAIDAVCNQLPGTLGERSSVNAKDHLPTIGFKPGDLFAEVVCGGKKWRVSLKASKLDVSSPNPPSATILRRQKVLRLVEATPSERFSELKKFIDVNAVQKCEDNLGKAIREMRDAAKTRTRELNTARINLKEAYDQEHTAEEKALAPEAWAQKRVEASSTKLQSDVATLKGILDTHSACTTLAASKDASQKDLNDKRAVRDAVKKSIDDAESFDAKTGIILVDLLGKASEFLKAEPTAQECPVCRTPKKGEDLAKEITERLGTMGKLTTLSQQLTRATQDVDSATSTARKNYTSLVGKTAAMAKQVDELAAEHRGTWSFDKAQFPLLLAWSGELTREVIAETDRFMPLVEPLMTHVQERHDNLNRQMIQFNAIKREYNTCINAGKEAKQAIAITKQLEQMLDVVHRERIQFIQETLDNIADECDRLYAQVHPGEKLGSVRFALDEERKGSLLQTAAFEGHKGVAPQAYFSDSHLDTLAFCFFLAVAKHTTGGKTIVIIDDVFTSVDLNHIKRVLLLLLEEATNFNQMILATHQRRWLDLFMSQQAPNKDVAVIRLRSWTLDTGVCGDDVKSYLDELTGSLTKGPLNRREVGSLSGFLIECIVGEMTRQLNCSIKQNPREKYTGYDYLGSLSKPAKSVKVQKVKTDGELVTVSEGPPALHELVSGLMVTLNDVRNTVGDHFNWDAAEITDATVLEFGQNTEALCRMLLCDHCGGMAVKDRKTLLQCACGKLVIPKT